MAPDETASVNSNNRFIVYPGEADARSLSCAPPSGRCLPVHYATLDGRPIAPANLGYITTGRTVQLQVIRAHLQYRNGPPTKDGLDLTHPRTTPVNIGELTLTVRYPMRASFTDVVACLDTADQTFYIDSGVYRPTKNAEDQSCRETNLYIRVCRDTADSDPVELIQFFPRQGYYQYGGDDLRYTDDDRVRHFQNFVADACHATDVAYPSRTEGALLSSDCWSKRVHGGYVDYYTFNLPQSENVQIDVRGVKTLETLDPYIYLLRVDSGRGQNRTLRSLSAFWPPVFAGEQDVGPPRG